MAQHRGFEGFRQCLLRGAREAVLKRNPTYVQAVTQMVQSRNDLDKMLSELRPLLRGDELRDWHRLLETAESCRKCMRAAYTSVRLFHAVPSDDYLQASRVTLGEWTDYHTSSWIIAMHALLERVDQLVKQTCRKFLKERGSSWQRTQDSLLVKVKGMLEATRAMRVRHAHGFGYFDAMQEEGLWEFHVVAFPDVDLVEWGLAQQVRFRETWGKRFLQMTTGAFRAIDATFDELTSALGWEGAPSQKPA